jgi:hypothetical protein
MHAQNLFAGLIGGLYRFDGPPTKWPGYLGCGGEREGADDQATCNVQPKRFSRLATCGGVLSSKTRVLHENR